MSQYNVLISGKALQDMDSVYKYIAEELFAPVPAMNQYNRIADAILSLEAMPERIKIT
jgi:plasmid stabilization system protein ParE